MDKKMTLSGPWPGEEGVIPEPLKNAANANDITRRYLDTILIEQRMIDSVEADISYTFFNEVFSSPIMMPAFSHLNKVGIEGRTPMEEYALAAKTLNTVNFVGMETNEEYKKIASVGAKNVRIIKPFKDKNKILEEIKVAQETGAIAVGIDIDHVFGSDGKYDIVDNIELGPVTLEDLKMYVNSTSLPFIAKGVLSVEDAIKCEKAGVKALLISHHHGRMPFAIPPLLVLPEIKKAVSKDMMLLVDCHIDNGQDAYKALALGAHGVCVGRGILPPLLKEGSEGVIKKVNKMNEELLELMGYTNVPNLSSFTSDVLWQFNKRLINE